MVELIKHYHDLDEMERSIEKTKAESLIKDEFNCLIVNCPIRQENERRKSMLRIKDDIISNKQSKIQHYEEKLKKEFTKKELEEIYKQILEDKEVDSKEKQLQEIKKQLADYRGLLHKAVMERDEAKDEISKIKTQIEMDVDYQNNIKKLKEQENNIKKNNMIVGKQKKSILKGNEMINDINKKIESLKNYYNDELIKIKDKLKKNKKKNGKKTNISFERILKIFKRRPNKKESF